MFEGDSGLHIGTSSWSERDWVGVFYPPRTPSNEFIRHYASVYGIVEIDATFYAMPSEIHINAWRSRTPESFRFAAKVPKIVTHDKVLVGAEGDMRLFVETMQELGPRLAPLLLQFPYFNRSRFAAKEPFLDRLGRFLDRLPPGARYAVEIRNPDWIGPELQSVCAERKVAVAWTERARMPTPREWLDRLGGPSTDFVYIRWLGDHHGIEKITQEWSRTVVDRREDIEAWVPIIRELRVQGVDVFGFYNNHFAGHAPDSIELFRELYAGVRRRKPPRLEQGELF